MLDEQQRALTLVRAAVADVEAPPRLRARLEASPPAGRAPPLPADRRDRRGRRLRPARSVRGLAVGRRRAERGPGRRARHPAADPARRLPQSAQDPKLLEAEQDGVAFPSWEKKFGWKTTGERADKLDGRSTTTVFYTKNGKTIAYTIVGGDSLKVPKGGRVTHREGTELKVIHRDARTIVTWQRDGRTCVLSGEGVPEPTLVKLAAWHGLGSVPF